MGLVVRVGVSWVCSDDELGSVTSIGMTRSLNKGICAYRPSPHAAGH